MSEELSCGKCKTNLIVTKEYVSFKEGRVAYIRCPNDKCNNAQRISYEKIAHLHEKKEPIKSPSVTLIPDIDTMKNDIISLRQENEELRKQVAELMIFKKNLEDNLGDRLAKIDAECDNIKRKMLELLDVVMDDRKAKEERPRVFNLRRHARI